MEVNLEVSPVFEKNWEATSRFIVNVGGTRSTKTYSILQVLICKALQQSLLISIVRKSLPSLKLSVLRDFVEILEKMGIYDEENHNKTDNSYKLGDSIIEFFSIDDSQKRRGTKRDILYINEANEITKEDFFQLQVRTTQQVFVDFNPSEVFHIVDEIMPREDCTTIHSTFLDNPFLPEEQIEEIKRLKQTDPDYWAVYGLGEFGSGRKLVYHFNVVDNIPKEAKLVAVGLDWGFSNDPTAIVEVWQFIDELYFNELVYKTGLTNQDIHRHLEMLGIDRSIEIIADSADPKSIEELYRLKYNIKPAQKGPDSVLKGIDVLKRYKLNVVKSSVNITKELQNYKWVTDKNGNTLNQPVDNFNHGMDAIRYVALNKLGIKPKGTIYVKGL